MKIEFTVHGNVLVVTSDTQDAKDKICIIKHATKVYDVDAHDITLVNYSASYHKKQVKYIQCEMEIPDKIPKEDEWKITRLFFEYLVNYYYKSLYIIRRIEFTFTDSSGKEFCANDYRGDMHY